MRPRLPRREHPGWSGRLGSVDAAAEGRRSRGGLDVAPPLKCGGGDGSAAAGGKVQGQPLGALGALAAPRS
eukprot:9993483-Alexandrium_andersonii.AAC.1